MKPYLTEYIYFIKGIWSKLGINQRISLIVILLLVIGMFGAMVFWSSKPTMALLYSRLDQQDAAMIVEKLRDMKLSYTLKDSGSSIYVPTDRVYDLRLEFAGQGIPRGKGIGFEIFDKTSFGITDFVQKMNYIRAIQGEIARTISELTEVASARVHIVLPEPELFEDKQKETTASIAITLKPGAVLSSEQINGVRYLTASAVEGLDPKNITIIDQYGNILSKNSGTDGLDMQNASQLDLTKNVERYLSSKVQSMLEAALGVSNAVVRVSADLNFEKMEVTEEKFNPESAVVRSEQISTEKSSGKSGSGDLAGTASNLDNEQKTAAGGAEENNQQKETIKNTYEIDRKLQKVFQSGGNIKKLSVAVFIRKLKDESGKYIERDATEMKRFEDIIKSAIGFDEKRNDVVVVKEMLFNEETTSVQTKQLNDAQNKDLIVTIAKNLSIVIVAIVLVLVFVNLMKKSRLDEGGSQRIAGVAASAADSSDDLTEEEMNINLLELPSVDMELRKKALLYQKAITKIAQQNPDNLVQVLKSWLIDVK